MTKRKKKDDDIIVSSNGFSTFQVTASSWSISYKKDDGTRGLFVIEAGLPQGDHTVLESYNSMKRMVNDLKGGGLACGCENLLFLHPH